MSKSYELSASSFNVSNARARRKTAEGVAGSMRESFQRFRGDGGTGPHLENGNMIHGTLEYTRPRETCDGSEGDKEHVQMSQ